MRLRNSGPSAIQIGDQVFHPRTVADVLRPEEVEAFSVTPVGEFWFENHLSLEDHDVRDEVSPRLALFRELDGRILDEYRTADGRPKVEALNSMLSDEQEKFDSEERDALWALNGS